MAKTMTPAQAMQHAEMVKVWGDDLHMIEYSCKHGTPYILSGDEFIVIDKPEIKTRFCFGYQTEYSGREYKDAEKLRERCANSVDYFKRKNTEQLTGTLERLKDTSKRAYKQIHYQRGEKQMSIAIPYNRDAYERMNRANTLTELTESERAAVVAAYETELNKLNKRLDNYLKRYGLSRLKTWTYWADE